MSWHHTEKYINFSPVFVGIDIILSIFPLMLKEDRKPILYSYGFLLVLTVVLFSPYLFSGGDLLLARDQLPGYGGWTYFKKLLLEGTFPFWSDGHLAGMPSFDGLPGDSLYPPFLIGLFLFSIKHLHGFLFFSHTLLAGILTFHFVRSRFSLSTLASVTLAVSYMLNTNFVSHVHPGHTGKYYVLSWLPLGLNFLWGLLESGKARYAFGLAIFVGISIFTSHVQLTYFVLIGFFVLCVGILFFRYKDKTDIPKLIGKKFLLFWVGIIMGLGLGAPVLYPAMNYTSNYSARSDAAHVNYDHATSWSSHPEEVASLVVPEFVGYLNDYWGRNQLKFNSEYPGLMVLVLGILALVLLRGKTLWLLASVGILSIIFALGAHTPLFSLFYYLIPGVNKFRAPSIMLFWLATVLVIMGAYFFRDVDKYKEELPVDKKAKYVKRLLIAAGVLAGAGLLGSVMASSVLGMWNGIFAEASTSMRFRPPYGSYQSFLQLQESNVSSLSVGLLRFGMLAGGVVLAVAYYLQSKLHKKTLLLVLMGISVVDLLWADMRFIQTIDPKPIFNKISLFENLSKKDQSFYRVFDLPGAFERGFHFFYGFKNVSGFYDNELAWYREYHGGSQDFSNYMKGLEMVSAPSGSPMGYVPGKVRGSKFLDMLAVKYVLARDNSKQPLYLENETVLPHAYWVPRVESQPLDKMIDYMLSPQFDPKEKALVAPEDADKVGSLTGSGSMVPAKVDYGNSKIEIEVNAPSKGMLVISEVYFPYWTATVDGKPTEILRTNYTLRGIVVEPGPHKIVMTFRSLPWITGWGLFGLGVVVVGGGIVLLRRKPWY